MGFNKAKKGGGGGPRSSYKRLSADKALFPRVQEIRDSLKTNDAEYITQELKAQYPGFYGRQKDVALKISVRAGTNPRSLHLSHLSCLPLSLPITSIIVIVYGSYFVMHASSRRRLLIMYIYMAIDITPCPSLCSSPEYHGPLRTQQDCIFGREKP
eukprot:TRINITY_DN234_c0_g1_i8.p1 TRINITY_DN234_c0_g1~~TRINITY_DN234_c0_g1_i8.p1  ORF type:complete len:156 (+),score=14.72 TRINITY_DN234_c0_g1_i8:115-582(+)